MRRARFARSGTSGLARSSSRSCAPPMQTVVCSRRGPTARVEFATFSQRHSATRFAGWERRPEPRLRWTLHPRGRTLGMHGPRGPRRGRTCGNTGTGSRRNRTERSRGRPNGGVGPRPRADRGACRNTCATRRSPSRVGHDDEPKAAQNHRPSACPSVPAFPAQATHPSGRINIDRAPGTLTTRTRAMPLAAAPL
jgi:hypothetical protein